MREAQLSRQGIPGVLIGLPRLRGEKTGLRLKRRVEARMRFQFQWKLAFFVPS